MRIKNFAPLTIERFVKDTKNGKKPCGIRNFEF